MRQKVTNDVRTPIPVSDHAHLDSRGVFHLRTTNISVFCLQNGNNLCFRVPRPFIFRSRQAGTRPAQSFSGGIPCSIARSEKSTRPPHCQEWHVDLQKKWRRQSRNRK